MALASIRRIYKSALLPKKFTLIDKNNEEIEINSPPRPKMNAKTVLASLVIAEHNIVYKGNSISLTYYSYADKLEVIYSVDSLLGLDIKCSEMPINEYIEEYGSSLFDYYVPTVGYTQKTRKTLSLITTQSNKTIVPMIVIGTDAKLENYIQDNFQYSHFLDLNLLHETTNTHERIKIETYNRQNKDRQKMPQKEFGELFIEDIIPYYLNINNSNVIPVLRITTNHKASLNDAKNINKLINKFGSIALRINKNRDSFEDIESYLLPISNQLGKTHILLEENLSNKNNEINEIAYLNYLSNELQIVFLGENLVNNLEENTDNIIKNNSLFLFKSLQDTFPKLIYGDYCGFEKDTAVSPNGFPAKTARLFYINPDNIDEIIMRRERSGNNAWVGSMDSLQSYLSTSRPSYIKESHCEACSDIFNRITRFSLGDIKENCIIHNGTCNAMA